jgi:hypothetical protein
MSSGFSIVSALAARALYDDPRFVDAARTLRIDIDQLLNPVPIP